MKPRILVLEDDEQRIAWFREQRPEGIDMDVVSTAAHAIQLLKTLDYTQIMLDHDLMDYHYSIYDGVNYDPKWQEETGMVVAKFLGENPEVSEGAEIIVHSLNGPARKEMCKHLHAGRRIYRDIPFTELRYRVSQRQGLGNRVQNTAQKWY